MGTGAAGVGSVCVPFYTEAMSSIAEIPSFSVGLLLVAHLVLDPCLVVGGFVVLSDRGSHFYAWDWLSD